VINRDLTPLGRRTARKAKALRKLDDAAELPSHDVNNRVSFAHSGQTYSTATPNESSIAIPVVLLGSPQWVMSLASKMKAARTTAKKSQQQVADRIGVTKGAVSQWETEGANNTTPELSQFTAWCEVTGASADEILLNRRLTGLEKKIGALQPPLREYIKQAIELAESVNNRIPARFLTAPTKQTFQAFHQYLIDLEQSRP
jgi:transcriptional regulator with XRE-family HTH domain